MVADPITSALQQWEPVLAAMTQMALGRADQNTVAGVDALLETLEKTADWGALVPRLRAIIAGDRRPDLLAGLDDIDTAIATNLIRRLT